MKNELEAFFNEISSKFELSPESSHFAYIYHLRGSMHDNCKCYGPNEFDAVLKIKNLNELFYNGYLIKGSARWSAYHHSNGELVICTAVAQDFYRQFALRCDEQNNKLKDNLNGLTFVTFQYLSKISRLRIMWKGNDFEQLTVYVDIVLAFPFEVKPIRFPFGLRSKSIIQ